MHFTELRSWHSVPSVLFCLDDNGNSIADIMQKVHQKMKVLNHPNFYVCIRAYLSLSLQL